MALTEREQQMLEQLEKQFKEDDPQFAHTMENDPGRPSSSLRRVVGGVLMTIAGFGLLLFGLALPNPVANLIIGLTGFAAMVTGLYLATQKMFGKQSRSENTKTTGGRTAPTPKEEPKDNISNAAWWALMFWWV